MAQWLGQKVEERNGCLMVMNIGNDNFETLPDNYLNQIRDRVGQAHADGWMVLYVFDSATDPSKPPEYFDTAEEMDTVRMMFDVCGRRDSNFNLIPEQRLAEFNAIATSIINHPAFETLRSENFAICGQCSIDGQKVLLPPFDLP